METMEKEGIVGQANHVGKKRNFIGHLFKKIFFLLKIFFYFSHLLLIV